MHLAVGNLWQLGRCVAPASESLDDQRLRRAHIERVATARPPAPHRSHDRGAFALHFDTGGPKPNFFGVEPQVIIGLKIKGQRLGVFSDVHIFLETLLKSLM
jgi:hypothetical protein